jgi:hypothetical protein
MEMINRHLLEGNNRNSGDNESSISASELGEAIEDLQGQNIEDEE